MFSSPVVPSNSQSALSMRYCTIFVLLTRSEWRSVAAVASDGEEEEDGEGVSPPPGEGEASAGGRIRLGAHTIA